MDGHYKNSAVPYPVFSLVRSAQTAGKVPETTGTHCCIHLQSLQLLEIKVIKQQKHEGGGGGSDFTDLKICFVGD